MLPIFCKTSGIISKGIHNPPTRAPTNAIIYVMAMPILFIRIVTEITKPIPITQLRSEEHTSELQSRFELVFLLPLQKKILGIHNIVIRTMVMLEDAIDVR